MRWEEPFSHDMRLTYLDDNEYMRGIIVDEDAGLWSYHAQALHGVPWVHGIKDSESAAKAMVEDIVQ